MNNEQGQAVPAADALEPHVAARDPDLSLHAEDASWVACEAESHRIDAGACDSASVRELKSPCNADSQNERIVFS
ncbi:hypothetical protein MSEO_32290 [Mycobacterium seoulense]|uniref:Uncharacterized protein n=1 Tax=Mycobacterium seoulense TaxID=386911 RepID=A0A7I7P2G7_9MYCO|nr:hypothetical protein MSEO_32290 [Mycobacterium seoulense]